MREHLNSTPPQPKENEPVFPCPIQDGARETGQKEEGEGGAWVLILEIFGT